MNFDNATFLVSVGEDGELLKIEAGQQTNNNTLWASFHDQWFKKFSKTMLLLYHSLHDVVYRAKTVKSRK